MTNTTIPEKDFRARLDEVIQAQGYTDYQWIDPKKIIVSQWVRMKCMFGCRGYGREGACPPNVPTVAECERFFREYSEAIILHFPKRMEKPEERHAWSRKVNVRLLDLERALFLAGCERAFLLFMDTCTICTECTGSREECREPRLSRPVPEALAVDVYSTVRQFGFPIQVVTDYEKEMNRYAFLMVR